MYLSLTLPARINVLGNPSDALEGAHAVISAAVDIRAGAFVEEAEQLTFEALRRQGDGWVVTERLSADPHNLSYDGHFDLPKGAINRLCGYTPELRELIARRPFKIATWSDVPRQSGMGGSSLFVLLTLAALRAFYELDPLRHNDYVLAELTQRTECQELGITCGFADRYVPLFGGLAYMDFRDKLYHRPIKAEPYVTYERLEGYVPYLPLVIVYTGIFRDSGDVHGCLRPRYLEEYERYRAQGGEPPFMVRVMEAVGATAWRGKIALLEGDWATFGALMNENHRLVNEMMRYCGFQEGAGWANNLLIETALAHGALGAKLTGAGGGGSVFALVRPGEEERMADMLLRTARQHGLERAQTFPCHIARQGLVLEARPSSTVRSESNHHATSR